MSPYVLLAKSAVESYVRDKKIIKPAKNFPAKKSGVFVTIENRGKLRGCIGTYLPTRESITQEIIHNAIAAATEDYRFGPIQKEELPELFYTVYILSEPELVKNIAELDPKKYGIIVKTGAKSGLLLPNLERIDTIEQQISLACQKARINPENETIIIYKFTAEKYE